jgi:hypothetical protein
MIEIIEGMPSNIVAALASGQVTGDDYEKVLVPAIDLALEQHEKIRLLYQFGPEFKKFTTTALWDDAKVGFHHLTDFDRVAVICDVGWIVTMVKGIGMTLPGEIRTFGNREFDRAETWIRAQEQA